MCDSGQIPAECPIKHRQKYLLGTLEEIESVTVIQTDFVGVLNKLKVMFFFKDKIEKLGKEKIFIINNFRR